MKVINRRGSYQQPPAARQKKAEGKKRKSPCTPYREKGKGKEITSGFPKGTVFRAGARARENIRAALNEDVDAAVRIFHGTERDRSLWAGIAWRVGVEEFHYALRDKLKEDGTDGTKKIRNRAAAFQAFLNAHFPKNPPSPRRREPKGGAA